MDRFLRFQVVELLLGIGQLLFVDQDGLGVSGRLGIAGPFDQQFIVHPLGGSATRFRQDESVFPLFQLHIRFAAFERLYIRLGVQNMVVAVAPFNLGHRLLLVLRSYFLLDDGISTYCTFHLRCHCAGCFQILDEDLRSAATQLMLECEIPIKKTACDCAGNVGCC